MHNIALEENNFLSHHIMQSILLKLLRILEDCYYNVHTVVHGNENLSETKKSEAFVQEFKKF